MHFSVRHSFAYLVGGWLLLLFNFFVVSADTGSEHEEYGQANDRREVCQTHSRYTHYTVFFACKILPPFPPYHTRSSNGILLTNNFIAWSYIPKKHSINVLWVANIEKNGLKNQIHYMAFWQYIMVLWIMLREQMVISGSKYLLASVITLEKPRKYHFFSGQLKNFTM